VATGFSAIDGIFGFLSPDLELLLLFDGHNMEDAVTAGMLSHRPA
jgi:hypothetical protein